MCFIFPIYRDPITRLSLIIYCTFSFVVIGFDEVYPLWCATPDYLGEEERKKGD